MPEIQEIRELVNSLHLCPFEETGAWMQRVEDLLEKIVCRLEEATDA